MPRRKTMNYVDNDEMYAEIKKYMDTDVMSNELHMMFWKMANHIIHQARFNRYSPEWKEDMKSSAYVKCITVLSRKKYDMKRTNPFSYFTTVVRRCFLDFTVSEKRQKNIKEKIRRIYGRPHESELRTPIDQK